MSIHSFMGGEERERERKNLKRKGERKNLKREREERENKMTQILIQNDRPKQQQIIKSANKPIKRSKLATVPELDHKWRNRCRQSSIIKCAAATELVAIHQGKRKEEVVEES